MKIKTDGQIKTNTPIKIKYLGIQDYKTTLGCMRAWIESQATEIQNRHTGKLESISTHDSNINSDEEIWIVQHPSVYTEGQSNRSVTATKIKGMPLIQSDRGGKITYHGPGQVIAYLMLNLKQRKWHAQTLVYKTEQALLSLLEQFEIPGHLIKGAPGVYVNQQKIASLGFRIRKGFSYHGLSLNVAMDLRPFNYITPCGQKSIIMTDMQHILPDHMTLDFSLEKVAHKLTETLKHQLNDW